MSSPFASPRTFDVKGCRVHLSMPSHRDLHPSTVNSLLETQKEFHERGLSLSIDCIYGNSLPHHARTHAAWRFLKSDANRLFWVDSDMVWKASDFMRLVALSTVMDIVAGAYIAKQDPPMFMVSAKDLQALPSNEWGCIALDGLGLGFTCMTRDVVEAVAAKAPKMKFHTIKGQDVPHIFHYGDDGDGNAQGEDIAFLEDAGRSGFQTWVDPTIELGHVGPKVYRARLKDYLEMRLNDAA